VADRPLLNHVEMLYKAGERDHARAFFETMGFGVSDMPGGAPWLAITVDPESGPSAENVIYANEPTPAQRNLQEAFDRVIATDEQLADTLERYHAIRRRHPQYVFHFGASLPTHAAWKERLERLQEANRSHPLLTGRLDIQVSEPGLPGALGPLSQAFIYTDILMCGPLAIAPLLFDMQWIPEIDLANLEPIDYPDMASMV
jgi:hypothetical protein